MTHSTDIKLEKKEILDKLFSLHRYGIKPGLERTYKLAEFYGQPQNTFKSIHIAGTNGKGSTSTMLASVLMESGLKVGLYTSPHLVEFNERIQINGKLISDEELIELSKPILEKAEEIKATFFEITTILAFKYFALHNVDIAIIETGMGGRFDSTNIINPLLSIITKIDYDHKEFLGETLADIAFEKAGIIKQNKPVILSKNNNIVSLIIENESKLKKSNFISILRSFKAYKINKNFKSDFEVEFDTKVVKIHDFPLVGYHQLDNLNSVLSALEILKNDYIITNDILINGLKNCLQNFNLRSRCELISTDPIIIADASHNLNGINALKELIKISPYKYQNFTLVFGVMADKDIKLMLSELKSISDSIILTKPSIQRSADLSLLSDITKEIGFNHINVIQDPIDAYNHVKSQNINSIIVGSFYLIGEILGSMTL